MGKVVTSGSAKLGLLVVVPALLAGCALNEASASPVSSDSGSNLGLPQRPNDLPVAGMDGAKACTTLTEEQAGSLGVDEGRPQPATGTFKTPGCTWMSHRAASSIGITVTAAPVSIEEAQEQKQEGSPETAATYAVGDGFGAVQGQIPGAEGLGCFVDVDAAEGRLLEVGVTWLGGDDMTNHDMCAKAKQAAEFAVSNLQAQG
ncbi:DUF3558 domain-containing protein [Saccharopolyspora sp. 6T]|uniref:DUF3558 domain-containing protein n=1 Tax=Saccharopolyspora sp. 6T TaxID=2877238 RepID=UPI001CD353E5|nr:DUF3558 domain-containing protein [Saccharopolyspora sp. 6T]MCA1188893.1 DUF3558 domain-containing protein [Saccharopolyspora sp. 6T]